MLQSKLFTKTRKEAPKDEVSANGALLIKAGYLHKEMAGVYSYLPLGLMVMKKIEAIIRDEMNAVGGVEMKTAVLQNKDVWEKSGRWSDDVVDNWFKTKLKNGAEVGLSFTNEEAYSAIMKQLVNSYKDLPIYPYDFKDIFRNETRSKSGIMRGREFYWKALYSFSKDLSEHELFYEKMKVAYQNIFNRVGIGDWTYLTFAAGGTFSKFSHEFQAVTDAGEDIIYIDEEKRVAVNKEVYVEEVISDLKLDKNKLVERKAVEVGNIFTLGTKFSAPFDLTYKDENGEDKLVIMGSYGIGLGRLMGTVVEILSDAKGIVWPESIAPFKFHLVELIGGENSDAIRKEARGLYDALNSQKVSVLYDDRDMRAGEKFGDSDLIGIPWRIVVSGKTGAGGPYEVKNRRTGEVKMLSLSEILSL